MTRLPELDKKGLAAYLEAELPEFSGLQEITGFADGQSNPTYLLTASSGRFVLRRKPAGQLLKSAHAVDREYRVMRALADSAVPVPEMLHLCLDETIIGSVFFVMRFVEGRTFWNPALPELDSASRAACYDQMNAALAAIHSVDLEAAGLSDFGKPGNYFDRQISRWTDQYRQSETETIADMEAVISWLEANRVPDDGRAGLVHGDYRIDNMIFSETGDQLLAVLDWELSTLGHPFADLAYQCAVWRMPPSRVLHGLKTADRARLGIPDDAAYIAAYCRRMGLEGIDNWAFYLVFSLFRLAAIVQGVKKRALDGNAASSHATEVGALVLPLAAEAAHIAEFGS